MAPPKEIASVPLRRTADIASRPRGGRQREELRKRRAGSPTSVDRSFPLTWSPMDEVFIEGGLIRKLWGVETNAYRDHLVRLDAESRHNRFCAAISDEMIGTYAATAHGGDVIVHGFFVDGELRGAADLRIIRPLDLREAEAAFSIEKPWQSLGIGSALLERTLLCARNRGIKRLQVSCLMENQRMQHLASKFEVQIAFDFGSVIGKLENPHPTSLSIMQELMVDSQSFAAAHVDFPSRLLSAGRIF
jgi:GNAT superfamily N-acetyltransferase